MHRFIRLVKRVSGFFVVVVPATITVLDFFVGRENVKIWLAHTALADVASAMSSHIWTSVGLCAFIFSVSYVLSRISIMKQPTTTGGYLQEFESEMLHTLQAIRKTPEADRYIDNMDSPFYVTIKAQFISLCDKITELMNFNFNREFSVCIKLVDVSSSRVTTSAAEVYLRTFCRGGKDKESRGEVDSEKVALIENSDFLSIFKGAKCFSCGNLFIYRLMKTVSFGAIDRYKNSNLEYKKKYRATVVVPIRLQSSYVTNSYGTQDSKKNQLLGFLCIDCKSRCSPFAIKKMVPYMQAFADNLYAVFDEILSSEFKHTHRQPVGSTHTM